MKLHMRTLTMAPNSEMEPEALPKGAAGVFRAADFTGGEWQVIIGYLVPEDGDQQQMFGVQTGIPGLMLPQGGMQ